VTKNGKKEHGFLRPIYHPGYLRFASSISFTHSKARSFSSLAADVEAVDSDGVDMEDDDEADVEGVDAEDVERIVYRIRTTNKHGWLSCAFSKRRLRFHFGRV